VVNLLETRNVITMNTATGVETTNTTTGVDASIWIYQNPITANVDTEDYGYTTFINEFPNA
jgi:hypothetical protein